jgi:hypothetical protein
MSTIGKVVVSVAIILSTAFAITMNAGFRQRAWRRLHTLRRQPLVACQMFARWLVIASSGMLKRGARMMLDPRASS